MTTSVAGKGSQLKMKISGTYTALGQVQKITPPSGEMGTVELTNLASTAKEFAATIYDGGEAEFTIIWLPGDSTHAQVWTNHKAGTLSDFTMTWSNASTAQFYGIITKFPWDEIDVESVQTIPVTIKISGDVTLTP